MNEQIGSSLGIANVEEAIAKSQVIDVNAPRDFDIFKFLEERGLNKNEKGKKPLPNFLLASQ